LCSDSARAADRTDGTHRNTLLQTPAYYGGRALTACENGRGRKAQTVKSVKAADLAAVAVALCVTLLAVSDGDVVVVPVLLAL
jgi:hypothetical protein